MASSMFEAMKEELLTRKKTGEKPTMSPPVEALLESFVDEKFESFKATFELRYKETESAIPEDKLSALAEQAASKRISEIINGIQSSELLDGDKFARRKYRKSRKKIKIPRAALGLRLKNGRFVNSFSLAALLNIALYKYMQILMVAPKLVWRTGRFANSVQVTGIDYAAPIKRQRKARVSVFFSYMVAPYSVFMDPGYKGYTKQREPVPLIKEALRMALDDLLHKSSKATNIINLMEDV